jgi:hypothetical protein
MPNRRLMGPRPPIDGCEARNSLGERTLEGEADRMSSALPCFGWGCKRMYDILHFSIDQTAYLWYPLTL